MTEIPVPHPRPVIPRRRLLIAAACAMFSFGAGIAIPSVCLQTIGQEFHLTFAQRGFLITARVACLMVALLASGYLAERHGKRPFLILGLALIAVSQGLASRAMGYGGLLGAQLLSGAGKGTMEALVNPLVARLCPERSARMLNFTNGLFSVGLVFSALTTGEIVQRTGSWRLPFLLWIPPLVFCMVLFATRHYPPEHAAHKPRQSARRFLSNRLFWILFAMMILSGGCEAGLVSWGPNFVQHELAASARAGAWTITLYGILMAIGRFTSSAVVARLTAPRLMIVSAAGCIAVTFGLSFTHQLWLAWSLFGLGGLFIACFWPTILSLASDNIASGSTSLFALLASAGVIGSMTVPWLIGALGDHIGLRGALLVMPVCMVGVVALLVVVTRLLSSTNIAPDHQTLSS